MSTPNRGNTPMTLEEYFAFEEGSASRHEYVAGRAYAMSPVRRAHSRIALNIAARLWFAARGGPCRVHQWDMKVLAGDVVYYPDVMVACGPEPASDILEDAPCLLVEVTSRSTRATDRREKALVYRTITTLRTYLIVNQRRRQVERWWRDARGEWRYDELVGQGTIDLPCPSGAPALTLDDIYEGVVLPPLGVAESDDEADYEHQTEIDPS